MIHKYTQKRSKWWKDINICLLILHESRLENRGRWASVFPHIVFFHRKNGRKFYTSIVPLGWKLSPALFFLGGWGVYTRPIFSWRGGGALILARFFGGKDYTGGKCMLHVQYRSNKLKTEWCRVFFTSELITHIYYIIIYLIFHMNNIFILLYMIPRYLYT